MVSIVIPCFNAERLIAEAIESALGQTWPNCEVIVIDDGSTDGSLSTVRSFGNRVRWETGPNRGGNVARNRGLQLATGQFVQFLDADDILYPDKLAKMIPLAMREGQGVLVSCAWHLVAENADDASSRYLNYDGGDPFIWCLSHDLQTSSPLHWRSNLIAVGGFDGTLPRCQEFDLHLRLFKSGIRFVTLDEPLYRFRRQRGSVSSDFRKVFAIRREIQLRLAREIAAECSTDVRLEALARALAADGRQLVRKGYLEDGRNCFRHASQIKSGSVSQAFPNRISKQLLPLLGPVLTERLAREVARLLDAVGKLG